MRGEKKKKVRLLFCYVNGLCFCGPKVSSSRRAFEGYPIVGEEPLNQAYKHTHAAESVWAHLITMAELSYKALPVSDEIMVA